MPRRSSPGGFHGDERLIRQLPALLRQHRPELMHGEHLYRSPAGFTSWSSHWAKAVAVELAQAFLQTEQPTITPDPVPAARLGTASVEAGARAQGVVQDPLTADR